MKRPRPTKPRRGFVITIDGPSGTGKSTAARLLAKRLGLLYLDTGAMYRAIAWKGLKEGIRLSDRRALTALANRCRIKFRKAPGGRVRIFLDGSDVTQAIRRPEVSEAASRVATLPGVRRALVRQQQAIGAGVRLVAEGRDTGTVVFPQAQLKVFLTASPAERAKRRLGDLRRAGHPVALRRVQRDLQRRDLRDRHRFTSPLRPTKGAVRLDNTRLQSSQVVAKLIDYVRQSVGRYCRRDE